MSNPNDDLRRLADELPADLAGEVVDFAEVLRARRGAGNGPTAEDRAWLAAAAEDAAAGLVAIEADTPPEQVAGWLRALDDGATPVEWDDERGEFVEVAG